MSLTVSHIAFIATRPVVNLTSAGRIRVRLGDDITFTLDETSARALSIDLEGAVLRLTLRSDFSQTTESPLAG